MSMRVKEGSGAKSGSYVARFKRFVPTRSSKPSFLHSGEYGDQVRYELITDEGIVLPGSFNWDWDHYSLRNFMGAVGTPARAIEKVAQTMNPNQFLRQLEGKIATKGVELSVWVPDNGYVGSLKPVSGTFQVKFTRVLSRDDKDKPIHVYKSGTRTGRGGRSYEYEEDVFSVLLVVETGQHEGCAFTYRIHYMIRNDGSGWILDKSGRYGKQFFEFFMYHGIDLRTINPERFPDPSNLLPQLEKKAVKANKLLVIEVENGWVEKLSPSLDTEKVDEIEFDVPRRSSKPKKSSSDSHTAILSGVLKKETNSTKLNKKVISRLGSKLGKIPAKAVEDYTPKEAYLICKKLGYDLLANRIKEQAKKS